MTHRAVRDRTICCYVFRGQGAVNVPQSDIPAALFQFVRDGLESRGPVLSVADQEPDAVPVEAGEDAIAVMLGLVEPVLAI